MAVKLLDLSTVATAELKAAEKEHAATVGADGPRTKELAAEVQAWKRIVTLCDAGELILPDEERPAEAWRPIVATVQAKLERRVEQAGEVGQDGPPSKRDPLEKRIAALRALRDALTTAAIHRGAKLPPFDPPAVEAKAA